MMYQVLYGTASTEQKKKRSANNSMQPTKRKQVIIPKFSDIAFNRQDSIKKLAKKIRQ